MVGVFSGCLTGRRNAFGLFRLILAALVIVSHAFPIGGFGADPVAAWTHGQAELGDLAVVGFFALSGYLITKSARNTDLPTFLWRRLLRIMPAFWTVLLVTALVIAPGLYARQHGSMQNYWSEPGGPMSFVVDNALLFMQTFTIHDVFVDTPLGTVSGVGVLNGSLWTLFFEFLCYLGAATLAALGVLRGPRRWVVPALAALAYVASSTAPFIPLLNGFTLTELSRLGSVFLSGAVIATFEDRIPFDGRLATLAAVLVVASGLTVGLRSVGYIGLSYLVLWAAGRAPVRLHRIGAVNDLSYGVYIYAWPVQMGLTVVGVHQFGYLPYLLACLVAVVPLAALSWWLVEKPALRLKDTQPWARTRYPLSWTKKQRAGS